MISSNYYKLNWDSFLFTQARLCRLKLLGALNFFRQNLQVYGLSPVWIFWCTLRFSSRENRLPHWLHWCGAYPVWIFWWDFKVCSDKSLFPHSWQVNLFSWSAETVKGMFMWFPEPSSLVSMEAAPDRFTLWTFTDPDVFLNLDHCLCRYVWFLSEDIAQWVKCVLPSSTSALCTSSCLTLSQSLPCIRFGWDSWCVQAAMSLFHVLGSCCSW